MAYCDCNCVVGRRDRIGTAGDQTNKALVHRPLDKNFKRKLSRDNFATCRSQSRPRTTICLEIKKGVERKNPPRCSLDRTEQSSKSNYSAPLPTQASPEKHTAPLFTYRGLLCNGEMSISTSIKSPCRRPESDLMNFEDSESETLKDWYRISHFKLGMVLDASAPATSCYDDMYNSHQLRAISLHNLYGLSEVPFIRSMLSCDMHMSIYNVDLEFAGYTHHDRDLFVAETRRQHPLQIAAHKLARVLQSRVYPILNFNLTLSLWPDPVGDRSRQDRNPYFESPDDIREMWRMLGPLIEVPGLQCIKVRRLKGRAMWSRRGSSLYPVEEPFVVVAE